jgi:hypothetical protein
LVIAAPALSPQCAVGTAAKRVVCDLGSAIAATTVHILVTFSRDRHAAGNRRTLETRCTTLGKFQDATRSRAPATRPPSGRKS